MLGNGTGVIDADYQGSLKVCLWNRSDAPFLVTSGDRVAQLVIVPCVTGYKIEEVTSFEESTARGSDGLVALEGNNERTSPTFWIGAPDSDCAARC
ncbi:dUTP diphosphatase [Xanthomonas phage JGB6]|nr:dUTP diphosphatase [Xanthomonas phage JGB6]